MTDRSSHGFFRRTARRAAVLAGAAAVSLAVSAAPAQADTFTAHCAPYGPNSGASGVNIEMLGVTMAQGTAMRVTLMTQVMGFEAQPHAQFIAEHGQPTWYQVGYGDSGIPVSATPQGVAGSVSGAPVTLKAWYRVEYLTPDAQGKLPPDTGGGYTHPVQALDGSEWCRS